jgi:hypothetical protein
MSRTCTTSPPKPLHGELWYCFTFYMLREVSEKSAWRQRFRYLQLSHEPMSLPFAYEDMYSGRKITESLGNVTITGEKRWKE